MSTTKRSQLIFSSQLNPHLLGHVIHDKPIVSAATLLCSLSRITGFPSSYYRLALVTPTLLDDTLEVNLIDGHRLFITCEGRIVARGLASQVGESEESLQRGSKDLFSVDFADTDYITYGEFNQTMTNIGYEHSGEFKSVDTLKIKANGNLIYGEVSFKENYLFDVKLDGIWQSMIYALMSGKNNTKLDDDGYNHNMMGYGETLLVPSFFGRIKLDLTENAHGQLCGRFMINKLDYTGDYILFDATKHLFVAGKNLIFKRMSRGEGNLSYSLKENIDYSERQPPVSEGRAGIISTACRLPGNIRSIENLWSLLTSKEIVSRRIPLDRIPSRDDLIKGQKYGRMLEGGGFLEQDISLFDNRLFGISEIEAKSMDPQQRMLLTCVYEAMERAGIAPGKSKYDQVCQENTAGRSCNVNYRENRENILSSNMAHMNLLKMNKNSSEDIGFFVGTMGSEYLSPGDNNSLAMLGNSISFLAGRLNYFFDSRGSSVVIDTACSSSLVALDVAIQNLKSGRIQKAVVAGVNLILSEEALGQRANGNLLSIDGICHSFDERASGYGRSDGIVVIILEMEQSGIEYEALIEGTLVNHDGRSAGLTAPNGDAHYDLIRGMVEGRKIAFWECHGTGTVLGDPIEVKALGKVMNDINVKDKVYLSTAKAWIGHTEAASGLVGVLKSILQLKNGMIPGLPDMRIQNKQITLSDKLVITTEDVNLAGDICGVSSFGVSGTNACVIMSKCRVKENKICMDNIGVIPVSAKTESSLIKMENLLIDSQMEFIALAVCFSLHRRIFTEYRSVFCIRNGNLEKIKIKKINFNQISCELIEGSEYEDNIIDQMTATLEGRKRLERIECNPLINRCHNVITLLQKLISFGLQFDTILVEDLTFHLGELKENITTHLHRPKTIKITVSGQEFVLNSFESFQNLISMAYINIDSVYFAALYPNPLPYSILRHLQTYPFDERSFWKTEREDYIDHPLVGTAISLKGDTTIYRGFLCEWRHAGIFHRHIGYGLAIEVMKGILHQYERFQIEEVSFTSDYKITKNVWMTSQVNFTNDSFTVKVAFDGAQVIIAKGITFNKVTCSASTQDEDHIGVKYNHICELTIRNVIILDNHMPSQRRASMMVINDNREITAFDGNTFKNDKHNIVISIGYNQRKLENVITEDVPHPSSRSGIISPTMNTMDIKQKIISCIEKATLAKFDVNTNSNRTFIDLGLDSLATIGFIHELNSLDIVINSSDLAKYQTFNELLGYLTKKENESGYSSSRNIHSPDIIELSFENDNGNRREAGEKAVILDSENKKPVLMDDDETLKVNTDHHKDVTCQNPTLFYTLKDIKIDEKPEFHLKVFLKGRIPILSYKYRNTRSKITFKGLLVKFSHLKPCSIQITFIVDCDFNSSTVTQLFLDLGQVLLSLQSSVSITVVDSNNWLSAIGRAFLKSLAAENPGQLKYQHNKKLVPLQFKYNIRKVGGTWLISGGSSGIGYELAKHLAKYSLVQEVIMISRTPPKASILPKMHHLIVDITMPKDLLKVKGYLDSKGVKKINVIHSAGVSADHLFGHLTYQTFQKPFMAKCDGLMNLMDLIKPYRVGYMLFNSSVSSVFGNIGQTNYSMANAFLDFMAKTLNSKADRVISINWGNWNQTGLAANEKTRQMLEKKGFFGLDTKEALDLFDRLLRTQSCNNIIVAKSDWRKMTEKRPDLKDMLSEVIINNKNYQDFSIDVTNDKEMIQAKVDQIPIKEVIKSILGELLNTGHDSISDSDGFLQLGLDSLGMYSFSHQLNQQLQTHITVVNLFEYYNVTKLTDFVSQQTSTSSQEPTASREKELKDSTSSPSLGSHLSKTLDDKKIGVLANTKTHLEEDHSLPNLVFLFPGTFPLDQDLNWDLFSNISYLARQLRTCSEYFEDLLNVSIQKLIVQRELDHLDLPVQQAIIFSIDYSIAKFWTHCGLRPTHLLGHSLGELVAITLAGFLDLKQATKLVVHRAKGLTKARGKGQMVAAQREILSALSLEQLDINIAADNADNQIVLSGPNKSMEKVLEEADRLGLVSKVLNPEYPFHSKLIRDDYLKSVNLFSWRKVMEAQIPVISNVTARPLVEFTAKYIKIHAKSTVLFRESLDYITSQGDCVFLEAGLGHVLCSLVQKSLNKKDLHYLIIGSTVNGQKTLDLAKAKLELKGFNIDKKAFDLATGRPTDVFDDLRGQHLSVRIKAKWHRRLSEDIQGKDKQINPSKLLLNKRILEVSENDIEVIRDHVLFDLPTAPAAFLIKCFIDHAKFSEFKMADIRLLSKLYINDLDGLITTLDGQRLHVKNESKLFASCLIAPKAFLEDPEFPSDDPGVRLNPQVFYNSLSRAGFQYGPSLKLLCDIRLMTGNRIRTKCAAPKKPWISIDLALQTLSCGLFDPLFPCCYVPIRIGELYARLPLVNDKNEWTFHGEIIKKDPQMVEGNIAAFSNGVLAVLIKDVKAVRVSRNTVTRPLRRNAISTDDELSDIQILPPQLKRKPDPKNDKSDQKREKRKSVDKMEAGDKLAKETKIFKKIGSSEGSINGKVATSSDKGVGDMNNKTTVRSKLMQKMSNPEKSVQGSLKKDDKRNCQNGKPDGEIDKSNKSQDFRLLTDIKTKFKPIYISAYYGKFACRSYQKVFKEFTEISLDADVLKLQYDYRYFNPDKFGLSPREALFMDPAQRLLLLAADKLLYSLGEKEFPSDTGVFIGSSNSDYAQRCFKEVEPSGYLMSGSNQSSLSNRISHHYRLKGPSITVDTACSSFSTALSVAIDSIRLGQCGQAIVGAANLLVSQKTTDVLRNAGVLSSHHRCASFSDEADGYVRSEGFGLIMITTQLDKGMFEVKRTSSVHVGGASGNLYMPDKTAEMEAMLSASQGSVDMIECHGTGTVLGDRIELEAVKDFIEQTETKGTFVTSSKTHLGHSEAASGLASLLSVISIMNTDVIPKMQNFDKCTDKVKLGDKVVISTENMKVPIKKALINNYGFTGSVNSFLIEKLETNRPVNRDIELEVGRTKLWPFQEEEVVIERVLKSSSKCMVKIDDRHVVRWNPNEDDIINEVLALIRTIKLQNKVIIMTSNSLSFVVHVLAENFKKEGLKKKITVISDDCTTPQISFQPFFDDYTSRKTIRRCLVIGGNSGIGRVLMSVIRPESMVFVGRKKKELYPDNITFYEADVADFDTLDRITNVENERDAFDCVINCAGVVDNVMIKNIGFESLEKTFRPKVFGTKNLVRLCHKYGITRIMSISSIAALFASHGQVNYVLANSLMEKIMEESGLEYTILSLGPVKGAGMLAGDEKKAIRNQIEDSGWGFMTIQGLRDAFERVWWRNGHYKIMAKRNRNEADEVENQDNIKENIDDILRQMIRDIGGLRHFSEDRGLMSLGFDSLSIEELRQIIQRKFKVKVEPVEMFENVNFKQILQLIRTKINEKKRNTREIHTKLDNSENVSKKQEMTVTTTSTEQKMAVISFSADIPNCENEFEFFQKLLDGETFFDYNDEDSDYIGCSSHLSNHLNFDFSIFEISESDLNTLDLSVKYALKHSNIALERAGYTREKRKDLNIGVITCSEPKIIQDVNQKKNDSETSKIPFNPKKGSLIEMYMANQKDFLSLWISHLLHLSGPSFSVYSACSSTLTAIHQAKILLDSGTDLVIVTAVNILDVIGHEKEHGNILSTEYACRPFSKSTQGTLKGSFCGSLLLKKVTPDERVLAFIEKISLNNDGGLKKSNFMAPSLAGQAECITKAVGMKEVDENTSSRSIDYIECHGTGTRIGDSIEIRAMKQALTEVGLDDYKIPIGSIKANLGHCLAASGMASIIKCLLILKTERIPKQINISSKEDIIDDVMDSMFEVSLDNRKINKSDMNLLVNCFGIGGTNGSMVMSRQEQFKVRYEKAPMINKIRFLPISGDSPEGCMKMVKSLSQYLKTIVDDSDREQMASISNTLINNRKACQYRVCITSSSLEDAIQKLDDISSEKVIRAEECPKIATYLCHQGVEYEGILQKEIDECPSIQQYFDDLYLNSTDPELSSLSIYSISRGIFRFLKDLSIPDPTVFIGHSLGEYTALSLAGSLDHEQCRELIRERGRMIKKTKKANILAIKTSKMHLEGFELSAVLSDNIKTFITDVENNQIDRLKEDGIDYNVLKGHYGFHTSYVAPVITEFKQLLSHYDLKQPVIPVISTYDGQIVDENRDINYLADHLVNPVRIDKALKCLLDHFSDVKIILEIGPEGILKNLLPKHMVHIPTLPSSKGLKQGSDQGLWTCLADLWCCGVTVDLKKISGFMNNTDCWVPFTGNFKCDDRTILYDKFQREVSKNRALQADGGFDIRYNRGEFRTYHQIFNAVTFRGSNRSRVYFLEHGLSSNNRVDDWLHKDDRMTIVCVKGCKKSIEIVEEVKSQIFHLKTIQHITIVVFTEAENVFGYLVTGVIDEIIDENPSANVLHIVLEGFAEIDDVIDLLKTHSINGKGIPHYRYIDHNLKQLRYKVTDGNIKDKSAKSNAKILLVGYGHLGEAIHREIQRRFYHPEILLMSRSKKKDVDYIHCDLTDKKVMKEAVRELFHIYNRIDYCVFLAGVKPVGDRLRGEDEKSKVVSPKVALHQLLKEFSVHNIKIGTLILASSLSSVTGLPYISEYVMASNFLDGISINSDHFKDINNIISLQLPPLRGTEMMEKEGKLLIDNSVELDKAAEWMVEMMISDKKGILAYSNENPAKIREFIRGHDDMMIKRNHRMIEHRKQPIDRDTLKKIWKSILKKNNIKDDDDFFGLGGNSLNGLQLIWEIQAKLNSNISYEDLSGNSRFDSFCRFLESACDNKDKPIRRRNVDNGPLSYPQEQMYFLYKTNPENYNVIFTVEFEDTIDVSQFQRALFSLIKRQTQLRTVFYEVHGEIKQKVINPEIAYNRSIIYSDNELNLVVREEKSYPFDLAVNAFRVVLGDRYVVVNQQHIITDGWSISVFAREFSSIFRGEEASDIPINYIDYALYQRENYNHLKEEEYCNYLRTLPSEGTIIWNHRLALIDKAMIKRKTLSLSEELTRRLKQKAARYSTSLFTIFLTHFFNILNRFKTENSKTLVVGVPNAGRQHKATADLIGYFLNNWIVAVDVDEVEESFEKSLKAVENAMKLAEHYADIPYHKAVAKIRNRSDGKYPLFQTYFNYRHRLEFPQIDLGDAKCSVTRVNDSKVFPLSCTIDELDDANICVTWEWDPVILHCSVIEILSQQFIDELGEVRSVDVEIIEEEEPFEDAISMIFMQNKGNIAIKYPDGHHLTYGDLREKIRCNSLYLRSQFKEITGRDLMAEDVIPLWIDNNQMPVWILSVLHTGAAFCPIHVAQPKKSVNEIILMTNAKLVITDKKNEDISVPIITITYHVHDYICKTNVRPTQIIPDQLAYVLFTSGSSGIPKGVQVEHSQLNSFLQRTKNELCLNKRTVIGSTVNFTFDVSLFNLFGSLCFGGQLVLEQSVTDFIEGKQHFTHLFLTSAMFNSLSNHKIVKLNTDWLIVGGETPVTDKLRVVAESGMKLSQIYGPTEATIWTTITHYDDGIRDSRIIGTSMTPFVVAVPFSSHPRILNPGTIGELWILGSQVARGYLNKAEEFTNNAFGTNLRGFRTGDLVYQMSDKQLMFLGRTDDAVKIRGIRIDLQEIKNTISKIFNLPFHLDVIDDKIILIVDKVNGWTGWKKKLAQELSEHQIPSRLVEVKMIPLNVNGKVDAKQLRLMIKETKVRPEEPAFINRTYHRLVDIWRSILGQNIQINPIDNFFTLGGHSLSLIRLQSQIYDTFNVNIPLTTLGETRSVSDMAKKIEERLKTSVVIIRETAECTKAVYCLHAIGGTIFPYYSLINYWPEECNIYAIGYDVYIDADDLGTLARFYHHTIVDHAQERGMPFMLFGHSLGGILAWEVAVLHYTQYQKTLMVVAVDAWVLDNSKLNESSIKSYLKTQFQSFENRDELLTRSMKLCRMLKAHQPSRSHIPITLFKANNLGESEIHAAVRRDLTQEMVLSVIDNGWGDYCDDIEVIPVNGDHDSVLFHLSEQKERIKEMVNQVE